MKKYRKILNLLIIQFFIFGICDAKTSHNTNSKMSNNEIFNWKNLSKSNWRNIASIPRITLGTDQILVNKKNPKKKIYFGFKSPDKINANKSFGCALENEKVKSEKFFKAVTNLKSPQNWDCLIKVELTNGEKSYFGAKKHILKFKNNEIHYEFFFSTTKDVSETELREAISFLKPIGNKT